MRYPMWRRNTDGTEFVVHDKAEAYAEPEKIAGFLPNKPIPETATPAEPTTEQEANDEANDGLQDKEERIEEEVTEEAAAPKKRGRPKKVVS